MFDIINSVRDSTRSGASLRRVCSATPRRLQAGMWARGMDTRHCEWTPETKTVSPPCSSWDTITLARFPSVHPPPLPCVMVPCPIPTPNVGGNRVHRQQSRTFAVIRGTMTAPRPARHWRLAPPHGTRSVRVHTVTHDAMRRASAPLQGAQSPCISIERGLVTGAPFPRVYQSYDQRCAGTAGATRAAQRLPWAQNRNSHKLASRSCRHRRPSIHPGIYAKISHSAAHP